jgi:hypothetical protein
VTAEQGRSRQEWVRRIAADLEPGEAVAGLFQASIPRVETAGLLVVTSRRLIFYGADAIAVPLTRIRDVGYEFGHPTTDALALPNELVLRTDAGSYRLLIVDDGGGQASTAQRACEVINSARAQRLIEERLM